jgi:hypothetical protein
VLGTLSSVRSYCVRWFTDMLAIGLSSWQTERIER